MLAECWQYPCHDDIRLGDEITVSHIYNLVVLRSNESVCIGPTREVSDAHHERLRAIRWQLQTKMKNRPDASDDDQSPSKKQLDTTGDKNGPRKYSERRRARRLCGWEAVELANEYASLVGEEGSWGEPLTTAFEYLSYFQYQYENVDEAKSYAQMAIDNGKVCDGDLENGKIICWNKLGNGFTHPRQGSTIEGSKPEFIKCNGLPSSNNISGRTKGTISLLVFTWVAARISIVAGPMIYGL
ncbi:hypothetical protein GGS20DRAFT_461225 [Poronia punctata]|nr:hypothetical protein GGS20DRAFT_461225 [Poronia punctata]